MARTAGETTSISLLREIRKLYIKDFLSLKQISDKLKKDSKFKNFEGLSPNNLDSIIQRLKKTDIQGVPKFTTLELKTRPVYGERNVVDNLEKVKQVKEDAATMSRKKYLQGGDDVRVPLQNDQISKIQKKHGLKFGIVEKGKPAQSAEVTANAKKALAALKKDSTLTTSGIAKVADIPPNKMAGVIIALKSFIAGKSGTDRFDIPENLKSKINRLKKGVPQSYEALALKKGIDPQVVKKGFTLPRTAVREFFTKGTVFEHKFPRTLIPFIKDKQVAKALELTGERTSPFLNAFKTRYDNKQRGLVNQLLKKEISLAEYNKEIKNIRDIIRKRTGGYETGYIKFDKNLNPKAIVNSSEISKGFKEFGGGAMQKASAFKNAKYTKKLLVNYLNNSSHSDFNSLNRDQVLVNRIDKNLINSFDKLSTDYSKVENTIGDTKKFFEYAGKNSNNMVVQSLLKNEYGKGAGVIKAIQAYNTGDAATKAALEARVGCAKGCFIKTVTEEPQKLIRLFRGESFPQRNTKGFKSKAKFFNTTIPEIKKDTLSGQWFSPNQQHSLSYLAKPGRMKYVDVTPAELESFNKYKERVNKRPVKYSVKKQQGLPDAPLHGVTDSPHHQLIPRYKLKQMEKAGRLKSKLDLNPFKERYIGKMLVKPAKGVLEYDVLLGGFVDSANPGEIVGQNQLKTWAADNPINVKAGTEDAFKPIKKSMLKTVGRTLAKVGAPLPTALIDGYFIGKQIQDDKPAAEIAKDPLNWLGLATMSTLTGAGGLTKAGVAAPGAMSSILRMGMNPGLIRGISRFAGLPGLAISTGLTAYDQYKKYQNEEGLIYNLFNDKSIPIN